MKKGGAGTVILLILFLLIMVVLLFPNQVQQFLEQINIPLGNKTYNLGQLSQRFTNGLQNYVNSGNSNSNLYNNFTMFFVIFPIFNAGTFNIGVGSESTYVGPLFFFSNNIVSLVGLLLSSDKDVVCLPYPIGPADTNINVYKNETGVKISSGSNITVYEKENNVKFSFSIKYFGGCNNSIDTINIQEPSLYIFIYSFDPNKVSYYNNYFGNSNYIIYDEINPFYETLSKISQLYNVTIWHNQYGFSCKPTGIVKLNPTVTISCSIDLNQLKSNPQIRNIENKINSVGNSSLWAGWVIVNVSYNCQ
jgi:hypothetical protein